jgi:C-terminal processing protease CtpA/Prc
MGKLCLGNGGATGRRSLSVLAAAIVLGACAGQNATIGAVLARDNLTGHVRVYKLAKNEGAAAAGLQPEDELLYVDGRDVRPMSQQELHEALVGPVDTTVDVTVVRQGKVLRLTIKRVRSK